MFNNFNTRNSREITLYVNTKFRNVEIRDEFDMLNDSTEILFVEVDIGLSKFVAGVVYKESRTDSQEFVDDMNDILKQFKRENKKFYISGDLNIDLLKVNGSQQIFYLSNFFNCFNSL